MIGRRQGLWGGVALALGGGGAARSAPASGGFAGLTAAFEQIELARGGRLGVAVLDTGSGRRAGHRQDELFPLTSTFKLLASAAILARVDAGQDSLQRRIRFSQSDLVTYSPVTETQVGGVGMTLEALCEATMVTSDNTAGNLLLGVLGGPAGLTAYVRTLDDEVTRLDRWETALNEARRGDPRDTTSPAAMLGNLRELTLGSALSATSRAQLTVWLRANRTGDRRLRAGLPPGWLAGEKTGAGENGTNNDVGLLWPPAGAAPVLVTAYLTEGVADGTVRDAALADVATAVAAAWSR